MYVAAPSHHLSNVLTTVEIGTGELTVGYYLKTGDYGPRSELQGDGRLDVSSKGRSGLCYSQESDANS